MCVVVLVDLARWCRLRWCLTPRQATGDTTCRTIENAKAWKDDAAFGPRYHCRTTASGRASTVAGTAHITKTKMSTRVLKRRSRGYILAERATGSWSIGLEKGLQCLPGEV